jgi:1,4-dihydroxy-2-naphthoate octaprenyltransferase
MPLWVGVITFLTARTYFGGGLASPPDLYAIPLGVLTAGFAMGWMLIGVGLVWDSHSAMRNVFASVVFTIPATLLVLFGPAAILILQNLG